MHKIINYKPKDNKRNFVHSDFMKVEVRSKALNQNIRTNRVIGKYSRSQRGSTVIFIGGIHGNEPAGVFALHHVLNNLKEINPNFRGDVYGFAGNLTALSRGVRYVQKDLNRIWTDGQPKETTSENNCVEENEQAELYTAVKKAYNKKNPVIIIDLHTTSSESQPFTTIGDTLRNRVFAMRFPIPIILGIEEEIEGTLLNFISDRGFITLGFESGHHDARSSIEIHTALIWLALFHAKCIKENDIPNLNQHYQILLENSPNNQKIFEVRYRYDISELREFIMNPGFQNFQSIRKGENLARNELGAIYSKEKGMIFMPLYQKQGDDGFFVVREIMPFWLRFSTIMRKIRFEKILPYLPGINKHPQNDNMLIVNTKIARWFVIEFFHLLGYRRETKENGKLVVAKRKYDTIGPFIKS